MLLYLTVILLLIVQNNEALRILGIFPLPGKSHFIMCESLMRGLAAKGHQVDVYSHFPLKKPVPNYNDYSLAGSLPQLQNNVSYEFINTFTESVSMEALMKMIGYPVCDLLNLPNFQKLIRNPPQDPPYDIVIVEVTKYLFFLSITLIIPTLISFVPSLSRTGDMSCQFEVSKV